MDFSRLQQYKLILASKSPRRQFLLKELGLNFEVFTKEVDESFPSSLKAEQIPLFLCEKKAHAFDAELDDHTIVITADTVVWIHGQVLNKPEDRDDAIRMLKLLSGQRHEVYTGVCLHSKNKLRSFSTKTNVYFKSLSESDIQFYIDHFRPFDKAGSYGAQECLPPGMNPCSAEEIEFLTRIGKVSLIQDSIVQEATSKNFSAVDKLEGSYFNVMGLPIRELAEELLLF